MEVIDYVAFLRKALSLPFIRHVLREVSSYASYRLCQLRQLSQYRVRYSKGRVFLFATTLGSTLGFTHFSSEGDRFVPFTWTKVDES